MWMTPACDKEDHQSCSGLAGQVPRRECECTCHGTRIDTEKACPPHDGNNYRLIFQLPVPGKALSAQNIILRFCQRCQLVYWEDGGEQAISTQVMPGGTH